MRCGKMKWYRKKEENIQWYSSCYRQLRYEISPDIDVHKKLQQRFRETKKVCYIVYHPLKENWFTRGSLYWSFCFLFYSRFCLPYFYLYTINETMLFVIPRRKHFIVLSRRLRNRINRHGWRENTSLYVIQKDILPEFVRAFVR